MFDRLKQQKHVVLWLGAALVFLVLAACSSADNTAGLKAQATAAYQQSADGVVMIEAEYNQGSVSKGRHRWQFVSRPKARGGKAMQALPDTGANYETNAISKSPRLDYQVSFNRVGVHTVQVRGKAKPGASGSSDSVHIGFDGKAVASADKIVGFRANFNWSGKTRDGVVATIYVPSPGVHTINVWMREDGFTFDALKVKARPNSGVAPNPNPPPITPSPERRPGVPDVQALSAASFVDTIGVNTHLHYQTTVYDTRYEDLIKPKLLELGVRHVRDSAHTYGPANRDTFYYRRLRELGAAGIDFNLLTSLRTPHGEATDYSKLDDIVSWTDGAVTSFEGINEPDIQGIGDWVAQTRAAQKQLYETVRGNAALGNVKVLGPSPVWQVNELGDLSNYLDYGSIHPYLGGKMPTGSEYNQSTRNIVFSAAANSGNKPVMITETGYHNALETSGDHPPASEEVTAKYLPRLFLEHFNMGVPRTYLYELIDSKPTGRLTDYQASFGLLRHDGSEKPAFRAVASLINLLTDPAVGNPGSLSYSVGGNTGNLHQTLLQKSDGTFYLALWLEKSDWDRQARRTIFVPGQKVTVTLGLPVARATLHTFNDKGQLYGEGVSFQNGQLTLDVGDTVRILELENNR